MKIGQYHKLLVIFLSWLLHTGAVIVNSTDDDAILLLADDTAPSDDTFPPSDDTGPSDDSASCSLCFDISVDDQTDQTCNNLAIEAAEVNANSTECYGYKGIAHYECGCTDKPPLPCSMCPVNKEVSSTRIIPDGDGGLLPCDELAYLYLAEYGKDGCTNSKTFQAQCCVPSVTKAPTKAPIKKALTKAPTSPVKKNCSISFLVSSWDVGALILLSAASFLWI